MSVSAEMKRAAAERVRDEAQQLLEVSHSIAANPELSMNEYQAVAVLCEAVHELTGIVAEREVGGLETAFQATAGSGPLQLTICAEYDALPEIGHGCGHNIIAAAALGAFAALAPHADDLGLTLRLLGTPAEESGGGKVQLLDAGAFDGVHVAMMVHPSPEDALSINPYASNAVHVTYTGKAAHASVAPHEGVNALDALTVALTAVGLARQQLRPGQQIHGSLREGGGAPNVIPASASATWMVRGSSLESLAQVTEVVERCARAGALAAGCEVHIRKKTRGCYSNMRLDHELLDLYRQNAHAIGREPAPVPELGGSTDMGNVSLVVPSIHPMIGLQAPELTMHTAGFAAAAVSPAGDAAVIDGATLLAHTAIDLATKQNVRARLLGPDPLDTSSEHHKSQKTKE